MGQLSAAQNVVLTNDGDLSLTAIAVSVSAGFQTSNNCGTAVAGHSSCSISVIFAPTQAGSQAGKLTVSDAQQTQVVALSGTGAQPAVIGVSPTQLSFPSQMVTTASMPLTLTVSNTGGVPMANVGFQITGIASGSFATGTTTCGATLGAGSSCMVQVLFTPLTAGGQTAVLTVTSSTLGVTPVQVSLNGIGLGGAGISISPLQMTFSVAILGQASAAQTGTITNTSTMIATGLTLSVTNPFSLTQTTCGAILSAGASCSAGVIFTPSTNGTVSGALTVSSNSSATSASMALSGTGGAAGSLKMQPSLLNFPQTGVGSFSNAQTVTVTNVSAAPMTDLAVSVSSGFKLVSSTCGGELPEGSSCAAAVAFAPGKRRTANGKPDLCECSGRRQLRSVPLSGMGADFTVALSGESSQTLVSSGQTARYTMILSPLSGSSGTFTFQCATSPAERILRV